jgi:hypothetical protein
LEIEIISFVVKFRSLPQNKAETLCILFDYIDDVLSLNNYGFVDFVDRTYPIDLEITYTTDTDRSASYLDLHLKIYSEGRLRTKLHKTIDDFNLLYIAVIQVMVATIKLSK